MAPKLAEDPDALKRRRERGRRSQAAYRKRQSESTGLLQDQNQELKDGIRKALDAVRGDENPDLLDALSQLALKAGFTFEAPLPLISQPLTPPSETLTKDPERNPDPSFLFPLENESLAKSQRLHCDIWLDPLSHSRVSLPPDDILPYLGQASETFAGRLFWSIMEHAAKESDCKKHTASVFERQGLWHSEATRHIRVSFIKSMVDARLDYKQTGSIRPENVAAGESDLGMVVHDRILKEYRARGLDSAEWLCSMGVEDYVRSITDEGTFDLLQRLARGEEAGDARTLWYELVCSLLDASICFGDGPRWKAGSVKEVLKSWTEQVLSTPFCTKPQELGGLRLQCM